MRQGLIAQWRRGIAARGISAAALFAVPVAVATAIGFGGGLAGLGGGLSSLAAGPSDQAAAESGGVGSAALERVGAQVAAATTPTLAAPVGSGSPSNPSNPPSSGGTPTVPVGGGPGLPGGGGGGTLGGGGGGGPTIGPPVENPGGGMLNTLLPGAGDMLNTFLLGS